MTITTNMVSHRFKACAHTCPHDDDAAQKLSRRQDALRACYMFHIVGNTVACHEGSRKMHPLCDNSCPAHLSLCDPCHCPPVDNPPQFTKGCNPTHQEWLQWGQTLYDCLETQSKRADWPQYYKDMVTGGPQPISPDPDISIWITPPPIPDTATQSLTGLSSQPLSQMPSSSQLLSPTFQTSPSLPNASPLSPVLIPPELPQQFISSIPPQPPCPTPSPPRSLSPPQPSDEQPCLPHDIEHSPGLAYHLSAVVVQEVSCHANSASGGLLKIS